MVVDDVYLNTKAPRLEPLPRAFGNQPLPRARRADTPGSMVVYSLKNSRVDRGVEVVMYDRTLVVKGFKKKKKKNYV